MTLLEVARVVKPHGLSGETVVDLLTNRLERLAPRSALSVVATPGERLPFVDGRSIETLVVSSSRPHKGRYLVRFDTITRYEEADALRGVHLYAEPVEDDGSLFVHELIGKRVVEVTGEKRGTVTGVQANPASDLLIIDERYFVPVRFVVSNNDEIVVDVPEGLFS